MSDFAICDKCERPLWQSAAFAGRATHYDDLWDRDCRAAIRWISSEEATRRTKEVRKQRGECWHLPGAHP